MTNHETAKHLRDAQRRLRSVLVANADRLSTPFTDDPSKNPWDTYLRPAVRGLQEAVSAACDALAAAAAVSVPPPAPRADDQTALRDRIAEAEERAARYLFEQEWTRTIDHDAARQLLAAVLPEPTDQAAVLRWAADRLAEEIQRGARFSHEDARQPGLAESVMLLRRWADEAQGAAEYSRALATPPSAEAAAYIRERLADEVGDDHSCAESGCSGEPGPVAGEQQNETPEGDGCWCGHPKDRHWAGSTRMTFPDGCHDCRGWNGAHGYGQELPWLPEGDEPAAGARQDGAQPCAECSHPKDAHREGDDPVTPGTCGVCDADNPDEAHHDFAQATP